MSSAAVLAFPPVRRWTEPDVPEPSNGELLAAIGRVEERVAGLNTRFDDRLQSLGREIGDLRKDVALVQAKPVPDPLTVAEQGRQIALINTEIAGMSFVTWKQLAGVLTLVLAVSAFLLPLLDKAYN